MAIHASATSNLFFRLSYSSLLTKLCSIEGAKPSTSSLFVRGRLDVLGEGAWALVVIENDEVVLGGLGGSDDPSAPSKVCMVAACLVHKGLPASRGG